jgi:putative transposase
MKRSRFTEEQIIGILREQEAGVPVADLCRKHGLSSPTFYKWKAKYGGMDVSEARRLKALEDENAKLKRMLAWADGTGVGWHYIAPGKPPAKRLQRELQWPPARRTAERDAVPVPAARPCRARNLAARLQRNPAALEAGMADAAGLRRCAQRTDRPVRCAG